MVVKTIYLPTPVDSGTHHGRVCMARAHARAERPLATLRRAHSHLQLEALRAGPRRPTYGVEWEIKHCNKPSKLAATLYLLLPQ